MRLVNVESPYSGDIELNVEYARLCLRDCLERGEAPIASHLLYTQPGVLNDNNSGEREWGIQAGFCWNEKAEATVVYVDLGISKGMIQGIKHAKLFNRKVEFRSIHTKELLDAIAFGLDCS